MAGLPNLYFRYFVMLLTDLTGWWPCTLAIKVQVGDLYLGQVTIWAMSNSKISSDIKWPAKEGAMQTFPSSDTD